MKTEDCLKIMLELGKIKCLPEAITDVLFQVGIKEEDPELRISIK